MSVGLRAGACVEPVEPEVADRFGGDGFGLEEEAEMGEALGELSGPAAMVLDFEVTDGGPDFDGGLEDDFVFGAFTIELEVIDAIQLVAGDQVGQRESGDLGAVAACRWREG